MIIDHPISTEPPIELPELLARLRRSKTIDHVAKGIYVEDEIREVGTWLTAYSANRMAVVSSICSELVNPGAFQHKNDLQAPTFIIYRDDRITLRLVLWLPLQGRFGKAPFSYEEPHDHNFDFWTVNFFGNGYRTRLYEYAYDKVSGFNDEAVTLTCCGDAVLSPGKMMFYTRSKDVHIQYPPDDLSVSLNLIVQPEQAPRQYEFGLDTTRQQGLVEARIKKGRLERYNVQESLFRGLMNFGDAKSRELVLQVAQHNHNEELRAIAFNNLLEYAQRSPNNEYAQHIAALAASDPSAYVKSKTAYRIRDSRVRDPNSAAQVNACDGNSLEATTGEIA